MGPLSGQDGNLLAGAIVWDKEIVRLNQTLCM
jgi:hypothetical protein